MERMVGRPRAPEPPLSLPFPSSLWTSRKMEGSLGVLKWMPAARGKSEGTVVLWGPSSIGDSQGTMWSSWLGQWSKQAWVSSLCGWKLPEVKGWVPQSAEWATPTRESSLLWWLLFNTLTSKSPWGDDLLEGSFQILLSRAGRHIPNIYSTLSWSVVPDWGERREGAEYLHSSLLSECSCNVSCLALLRHCLHLCDGAACSDWEPKHNPSSWSCFWQVFCQSKKSKIPVKGLSGGWEELSRCTGSVQQWDRGLGNTTAVTPQWKGSCDITIKMLWFFFFARRAELIKGKLQGLECILYLVTILIIQIEGNHETWATGNLNCSPSWKQNWKEAVAQIHRGWGI